MVRGLGCGHLESPPQPPTLGGGVCLHGLFSPTVHTEPQGPRDIRPGKREVQVEAVSPPLT